MKFNIFKTRDGKLKNSLEFYLKNRTITDNEIEFILDVVKTYEKDNLATIDKLKREKIIETKRINGAIKSFLDAHPILTKDLIGSLSKRIYGALLSNHSPKEKDGLITKMIKWIKR